MKFRKFLFLAVLYLMAFSSFVVFSTSLIPWVQYRFFSNPAILSALSEPPINGPEDEIKQMAYIAAHGSAVQLKLPSGERIETRAHLTNEQLRTARTEAGLNVLFRKADNIKVQFVTSLDEIDSPWLWLVLWLVFSSVSIYAQRLFIREIGKSGRS